MIARPQLHVALGLALLLAVSAGAQADPAQASVLVRGRGDHPLAGVEIFRRTADSKWKDLGRTDDKGSLTLPGAQLDVSWVVGAWAKGFRPWEHAREGQPTPVEVVKPLTEIRLDCGTRLTVDLIDAETGSPIAGSAWRVNLYDEDKSPWTASGVSRWMLLGPEGLQAQLLEIQIEGKAQDAYWTPGRWLESAQPGLAGGHAVERKAVIPVRRAVTILVRPFDDKGKAFVATAAGWGFDGGYVPEQPVDLRQKDTVLRLPYYRGVGVWTVVGDDTRIGKALVPMPATVPAQPLSAKVIVGQPPAEDMPFGGESIGEGGAEYFLKDPGGPRLEVAVVRPDGSSIEGARVRLRSDATASDNGVKHPVTDYTWPTVGLGLHYVDLPAGDYTVTLEDDRFVPISKRVTLVERGKFVRVELPEPRGVTVDVAVVDELGKPLPYAEVNVAGPAGGIGDAGVEPRRIDPFADAIGKRTFSRVDPGKIQVTARYGGWKSTTEVECIDGARVAAKVVLRPPQAAKPGR